MLVNVLDLNGFDSINCVDAGINTTSSLYNYSYKKIGFDEVLLSKGTEKHSLLIILSNEVFCDKVAEYALKCINAYSIVSIAFSYENEKQTLSFGEKIEEYKLKSHDKLNSLRPLVMEDGSCKVTAEKIIDNSICDSVRIKYRPRLLTTELKIPVEIEKFFLDSSKLYTEYKLYHRSASDGYFACRAKGDNGFYITATKTYKDNLDLSRIVYVEHYDEENNELSYKGNYLPSSDAVEAAIYFQNSPSTLSLLHTHASTQFTRNPEYIERILVPIESYGEPELGYKLVNAMSKVNDGFVIMEDHGEVFANNSLEFSDALISELNKIASETSEKACA